MLSTHDKIYGRFTDPASVKVGQTYSVYRTEGPIRHPNTGEVFGYKTLILGSARVVALNQPNQKVATLIVGQSYDVMERGNYLGPWSDRVVTPVAPRPNQASLDGVIIGVNPSIITGVAEYSVVYLDKGKADGVEEGNTFSVVRSGDPYGEPPDRPKNDPSLPREVIGSLVVFDVKENASTAYVRRSRVELLVGDHVEMRPGASRPGAGG
jgi:hypothetical protein